MTSLRLRRDGAYRVPAFRAATPGFTLMELLVVILIIGLLTGIVGPRLLGQISRSEVTTAKAQMDAFDKALQAYRMDAGHFPTTTQGLSALLALVQFAPAISWRAGKSRGHDGDQEGEGRGQAVQGASL